MRGVREKFSTGRILHLDLAWEDAKVGAAVRQALEDAAGVPVVVAGPLGSGQDFDQLWTGVVFSLDLRWQRYFAPSTTPHQSPSKWDLVPDVDAIARDCRDWVVEEVVTMGCLLSFFNQNAGQELLEMAGYENLVAALQRVGQPMRAKICALADSFQGW